ncbi:hypothetical protein LWI29_014739 [Acer saccharum]|uniref:Uncharacterized protein n=1 Tax=Acer saccharum TaxID=4024 RepID=A0AA39RYQ7_ACESA|nr:hypothetical protein LWI29_014739 [Acer saccharum]
MHVTEIRVSLSSSFVFSLSHKPLCQLHFIQADVSKVHFGYSLIKNISTNNVQSVTCYKCGLALEMRSFQEAFA